MSSDSKEVAKLKKFYRKWPMDRGFSGTKTRLLTLLPRSLALFILKNYIIQSSYKLTRESTKFFELSIRAYGTKKPRKCKRLLYVAIKLLSPDFPNHYSGLLRNSVATTLKTQVNVVYYLTQFCLLQSNLSLPLSMPRLGINSREVF